MSRDDVPSTRPYLIRALHEWCTDHGFTPYIAVSVDDLVQVPREFVKNDEIVLNTSHDATSHLQLGNEFIEFKARFGGVARDVVVPVDHVVAVYARENGQGMAFPPPVRKASAVAAVGEAAGVAPALQVVTSPGNPSAEPEPPSTPPAAPAGGAGRRPALKRVK